MRRKDLEKALVASFEVLPQDLLRRTRKTSGNLWAEGI
jgi:hypothetical protein